MKVVAVMIAVGRMDALMEAPVEPTVKASPAPSCTNKQNVR
jgi:hypothetical protein